MMLIGVRLHLPDSRSGAIIFGYRFHRGSSSGGGGGVAIPTFRTSTRDPADLSGWSTRGSDHERHRPAERRADGCPAPMLNGRNAVSSDRRPEMQRRRPARDAPDQLT